MPFNELVEGIEKYRATVFYSSPLNEGVEEMTIIIFISMFVFAVITYLFFLGAGKCKSDYERELEDKEQMEYLRNYKNGGKKSGK